MANEQSTIITYPLNNSTRRFTIPFEYLARKYVRLTLLGTERKELVLNTDFRFVSTTQVETTLAYGEPSYNMIEIRRMTSATERLVDFFNGSVLRSRDLNVSAIQTIHIAEEARNMAGETLAEDSDGNLDARSRRIVNVAPAVNDNDAMNFGQVKDWSNSAKNQADRAQTQADRSQTQAGLSAGSATSSASSAASALTYRNATESFKTQAEAARDASRTAEHSSKAARDVSTAARDVILAIELTAEANAAAALASQQAAKVSENRSKTSETNSKTSETNSKTSETRSTGAATRAESARDTILGTEITSLANAQAAQLARDAASTSRQKAYTSETNAKTSETRSKASELNAKQYAEDAESHSPEGYVKKSELAQASGSATDNAMSQKAVTDAISAIPNPTWGNLSGKPSTFPPSSHKHPVEDLTGYGSAIRHNAGNRHNEVYKIGSVETLTGSDNLNFLGLPSNVGFYNWIGTPPVNAPSGAAYAYMHTTSWGDGVQQRVIDSEGIEYLRNRKNSNSTWDAWGRYFTTNNAPRWSEVREKPSLVPFGSPVYHSGSEYTMDTYGVSEYRVPSGYVLTGLSLRVNTASNNDFSVNKIYARKLSI